MIYFRAGLFAEGRTDYDFLLPLLDRLLDVLGAQCFRGAYEVGPSIGIDAPKGTPGGRASAISAAVLENWELCEIFVIHSDGEGDPENARRSRVDPGLAAARSSQPERPIVSAACVPVREIEAWMLVDDEVFRALLGSAAAIHLPTDPERDLDPKATLNRVLKEGGLRRPREKLYSFFGERVRFESLRALPAFKAFEGELMLAIEEVARLQGMGTEQE